jgi:minor extracellular serine protease Vpr
MQAWSDAFRHPPASPRPCPPSSTTAPTRVTIGGVEVAASFSGLAPGFVGLYQVNTVVPANVPTGSAVPVTVTIGGVSSNTVFIAVQ